MISKDISYQIHDFSGDIFCVLTHDNVFLVNPNYLDDFWKCLAASKSS